jgi:hypothetical protein
MVMETEIDVIDPRLSETKTCLMDRFRSNLSPDRSPRVLVMVFGMLKTFGGTSSDANFLNIDHFKRALVTFFKVPLKPREVEEIFQILNRNGDGELHVQDFIAGLQVKASLISRPNLCLMAPSDVHLDLSSL